MPTNKTSSDNNDSLRRKSGAIFKDLVHPETTYQRRTGKLTTYESIDFEEPDGEHMLLEFRKRNRKVNWKLNRFSSKARALSDGLGYGLTAIVGILVGFLYLLVYVGVEVFAAWRTALLKQYILVNQNLGLAWLVGTGTMLMFALIGALLVFWEPAAGTSGMPEVIAHLNGIDLRKHANVRSTVFKVLALICLVSSGLFSGYDGPMAQVGLSVAVLAINLVLKSATASNYFFGETQELILDDKNDVRNVLHVLHKKQGLVFAAAGAASGITAAFHSPLGGTVFALEEAISFYNPSLIIRTLFISTFTYFIVGFFGHIADIGKPIISSTYALFPSQSTCVTAVGFDDVSWAVVMGVLFGIFGAAYNKIVSYVLKFRIKYLFNRPVLRLVEVVVICLITSSVVIFGSLGYFQQCTPINQMFEHLEPVVKDCYVSCVSNTTFTYEKQSQCLQSICLPLTAQEVYEKQYISSFAEAARQCPTNQAFKSPMISIEKLSEEYEVSENLVWTEKKGQRCYYQLPSLLYVSPIKAMKNLLSRGTYNLFNPEVLAVFALIYLVLSILTYNIMLPSDLVIPNLIFGATIGRLFGLMINAIKGARGGLPIDPGIFALLGASAFWSGTSRIMLTIAVIMIESTLDLSFLLGIVVTTLLATIVGNWFGESLFHQEIHLKKFPFLHDSPPPAIHGMRVMDIMARNLVILHQNQTAKEIFSKLAACSHQGFPVVQEIPGVADPNAPSTSTPKLGTLVSKYKLVGVILRSQLKEKFLVTVNMNEQDQQIINGTLTRESAAKALEALRNAEKQNLTIDVELKQLKHTVSSTSLGQDEYRSELDTDETVIDLTKIMNNPPYVVNHKMAVTKAFNLFRHLGLRHLCVVDDDMCLVGILTRKDFLWAFEKHEKTLETKSAPSSMKPHDS